MKLSAHNPLDKRKKSSSNSYNQVITKGSKNKNKKAIIKRVVDWSSENEDDELDIDNNDDSDDDLRNDNSNTNYDTDESATQSHMIMGSNGGKKPRKPNSLPATSTSAHTKATTAKSSLENSNQMRQYSSKGKMPASKSMKATSIQSKSLKVDDDVDEEKPVYCICRKDHDGLEFMIGCDQCDEWFHGRCVGISSLNPPREYICPFCRAQDIAANTQQKQSHSEQSSPIFSSRPLSDSDDEHIAQSAQVGRKYPKPASTMKDEEDDDLCPVCDGDCTCNKPSLFIAKEPLTPSPSPLQASPGLQQKNSGHSLSNTLASTPYKSSPLALSVYTTPKPVNSKKSKTAQSFTSTSANPGAEKRFLHCAIDLVVDLTGVAWKPFGKTRKDGTKLYVPYGNAKNNYARPSLLALSSAPVMGQLFDALTGGTTWVVRDRKDAHELLELGRNREREDSARNSEEDDVEAIEVMEDGGLVRVMAPNDDGDSSDGDNVAAKIHLFNSSDDSDLDDPDFGNGGRHGSGAGTKKQRKKKKSGPVVGIETSLPTSAVTIEEYSEDDSLFDSEDEITAEVPKQLPPVEFEFELKEDLLSVTASAVSSDYEIDSEDLIDSEDSGDEMEVMEVSEDDQGPNAAGTEDSDDLDIEELDIAELLEHGEELDAEFKYLFGGNGAADHEEDIEELVERAIYKAWSSDEEDFEDSADEVEVPAPKNKPKEGNVEDLVSSYMKHEQQLASAPTTDLAIPCPVLTDFDISAIIGAPPGLDLGSAPAVEGNLMNFELAALSGFPVPTPVAQETVKTNPTAKPVLPAVAPAPLALPSLPTPSLALLSTAKQETRKQKSSPQQPLIHEATPTPAKEESKQKKPNSESKGEASTNEGAKLIPSNVVANLPPLSSSALSILASSLASLTASNTKSKSSGSGSTSSPSSVAAINAMANYFKTLNAAVSAAANSPKTGASSSNASTSKAKPSAANAQNGSASSTVITNALLNALNGLRKAQSEKPAKSTDSSGENKTSKESKATASSVASVTAAIMAALAPASKGKAKAELPKANEPTKKDNSKVIDLTDQELSKVTQADSMGPPESVPSEQPAKSPAIPSMTPQQISMDDFFDTDAFAELEDDIMFDESSGTDLPKIPKIGAFRRFRRSSVAKAKMARAQRAALASLANLHSLSQQTIPTHSFKAQPSPRLSGLSQPSPRLSGLSLPGKSPRQRPRSWSRGQKGNLDVPQALRSRPSLVSPLLTSQPYWAIELDESQFLRPHSGHGQHHHQRIPLSPNFGTPELFPVNSPFFSVSSAFQQESIPSLSLPETLAKPLQATDDDWLVTSFIPQVIVHDV